MMGQSNAGQGKMRWEAPFCIPTPSQSAIHKYLLSCSYVQRYCQNRRYHNIEKGEIAVQKD